MKNKLWTLFGCACVAAMTGCVSTPIPPMDRRVTVAQNLGTDLYVTDVRCANVATSEFKVFQANVVNNTSDELWVEWRVVWLDASGIEIPTIVSTWNNVAVAPNEVRALQHVAPLRDAVDMRFYVRRMR